MTHPELPEGPLTDKNGKQWDYVLAINIPKLDSPESTSVYYIKPHVERQPLFIDLAGNPVHEGERCFKWGQGKIVQCFLTDYNEEYHQVPLFKFESDCEKWVASNVKRNTDKEMYEWAVQKVEEIIKKSGNFYANNIVTELKGLIQEKCL